MAGKKPVPKAKPASNKKAAKSTQAGKGNTPGKPVKPPVRRVAKGKTAKQEGVKEGKEGFVENVQPAIPGGGPKDYSESGHEEEE